MFENTNKTNNNAFYLCRMRRSTDQEMEEEEQVEQNRFSRRKQKKGKKKKKPSPPTSSESSDVTTESTDQEEKTSRRKPRKAKKEQKDDMDERGFDPTAETQPILQHQDPLTKRLTRDRVENWRFPPHYLHWQRGGYQLYSFETTNHEVKVLKKSSRKKDKHDGCISATLLTP